MRVQGIAAKKHKMRINRRPFAVQYARITHSRKDFSRAEAQCGSRNQSKGVKRKKDKGRMGGRGIKKSQTLLPIPLPLIPLPKCFSSQNGGLRILPEMPDFDVLHGGDR
jgi:hypothetical protein